MILLADSEGPTRTMRMLIYADPHTPGFFLYGFLYEKKKKKKKKKKKNLSWGYSFA